MKIIKKVLLIVILISFITLYITNITLAANPKAKNSSFLIGDIDKDKEITINDLAMLKLHLIQKETLVDADKLKAADIDRNGNITIDDLARLKLHLLGLQDIEQITSIDIGREKITIKNRKLISTESGKELKMKGIVNGAVDGISEACYAEETLNNLVHDGFNTLRLNLSVAALYDFNTGEFKNDELEKLKKLCERAYETGIYIIIDLHTLQGFDIGFVSYYQKGEEENRWYDYPIDEKYCVIKEGGSEYANMIIEFWGKVAETLNGYKSVLAYELMNEPHIMWLTSQQRVLNEYERVLQGSIDAIREHDTDTIISIQPILNYINTNYEWTETTASVYPNIEDDKILLDSAHVYPDGVALQRCGVVNMTLADGAKKVKEPDTYSNEGGDGASRYIICDYTKGVSKKYSITTTANSSKLLGWNAISVHDNTSTNATLTADNFKIFKINDDGSETNIISLSSEDAEEKKNLFSYGNTLGKPISLNSDKSYLYETLSGGLFKDLSIGLLKGETIRIEIDIMLEGVSEDTQMEIYYQFHDVTPNKFEKSLITGYEQLEDLIRLKDSYSAMYGSPLFWGEFAITNPNINSYTNYKEYIEDFVKLGRKYNLNWLWFGLFSYIDNSDNGFGAYVSGKVNNKYVNGEYAREDSKRQSMWEYILPKLLELI